jgi:hypothetical protein
VSGNADDEQTRWTGPVRHCAAEGHDASGPAFLELSSAKNCRTMLFAPFRRVSLAGTLLLAAVLGLAGCSASRPAATGGDADATAEDDGPFKPFSEVVPEGATADEGLLTVHRAQTEDGKKLFFQIPDSLLGREMLLVSRLAQVPPDISPYTNAGRKVGERVVRWTLGGQGKGQHVLLKPVSYASVAGDSAAVSQSVEANTFEPILASFPVEARGPEAESVVIDATKLFTSDVQALSGFGAEAREALQIRGVDSERTFVDEARSFPKNVNVRHTVTYNAAGTPTSAETGALSIQFNQSMVALPQDPMEPRPCDPRVGYFDVERVNYGSDALKAEEQCLISRWQLVPKDRDAYRRGELVEPKSPIVYYLDPATPERWRPYFKKGIEDWNKAFREAGFKNAIVAKEPPTDDSTFTPGDVRYSTVRYVASDTRNAIGPSVVDPRSGEIIESDIIWYHNHIRSYRNRLMIETGAANPEARSLELSDDLIGETMRKVIAHEVGHAIGLPHNMIASSSYPVDSLRSPTFTSTYGVAASIMDYARQNYIAQPGDGVERFVRKIGPYDKYAVEWGYRRWPNLADRAVEDRLNQMIRAHADDPMYRFGGGENDPRAQTEDLGDDPVKATRLAVKNLKRVVPNLVEWTEQPGDTYADLEQIYGELLGMWRRYMGHVADVVGGEMEDRKVRGQEGLVYTPVAGAKQAEAVQFLGEHAFQPPTWLLEEDVLRRVDGNGAMERMRRLQVGVLRALMRPDRLMRVAEQGARRPAEDAYTLADLMSDVKRGVWGALDDELVAVGPYARQLQRSYLSHAADLLENEELDASDVPAALRSQLQTLREEAGQAAARAANPATRRHLEDVAARVERILYPGGRTADRAR